MKVKKLSGDLQKLTDEYIKKIENKIKDKEQEILKVWICQIILLLSWMVMVDGVKKNIIISLIKNNAEIYLVDPKMVEFSAYEECENIKRIIYSIDENASSSVLE